VAIDVAKLKNIKMLVLDVDGILTDCKIFLDSNGEWKRFYSIRDGVGIKALLEANYKVAIITGSNAIDVRARVKMLGINYLFESALDKIPAFENLQKQSGLTPAEMAYMGDDYFDVPLLKQVQFAATVPDAMSEALEAVHYVTQRPAGNGAVREVCDYLLKYGFYAK
jgi:3-deoxy-D-manno-octulosonate 8-phosphate phosphatase (KDO 8-P phosphatase)